jgi:ATPase subunit of ABC transporter with duplicated ATPase domains
MLKRIISYGTYDVNSFSGEQVAYFCFAMHRRYGLLGLNGCGKSTLLTSIGLREVPIPEHMDIYHLTQEIDATDMTSLEAVMNVDEERLVLEKEAEKLAQQVSARSATLH